MCLCGITASLCGGKASEGVFVGVFLSMSSTAVDCTVGLLFALLPILGGTSGVFQGMASMAKLLVVLLMFLNILSILCRTCVPWFLRLMIGLSSHTNELYQLASVAFCLLLVGVEPIQNFFAALFLSSIGMLIHVHFVWNHIDILVAAVILVVIIKTIVVAAVVKGFGYTNKAALLVSSPNCFAREFALVVEIPFTSNQEFGSLSHQGEKVENTTMAPGQEGLDV